MINWQDLLLMFFFRKDKLKGEKNVKFMPLILISILHRFQCNISHFTFLSAADNWSISADQLESPGMTLCDDFQEIWKEKML